MLVDLGRNDLSRVCRPGTVQVERFLEVERFSHVTHLVSEVAGEIAEGVGPWDLLRATLPGGNRVGRAEGAGDADHLRAGGLPARVLRRRRRLCDPGRSASTRASRMRTMLLARRRRHLQAGGGVVADSDPTAEYEECLNKLAALERAIDAAEAI